MNIILLSGGSGKRLWPLSNDVRSKQFIKLFKNNDEYESMVQRVYRQITTVDADAKITIATSKSQASAIKNQLGEKASICVEPCRRDTFPAIALAAAYLHDELGVTENEAVVVCPVDPYVDNTYYEAVKTLQELAEQGGANLTLMGIEPTYPSEKYGYIIPESGENVSKVKEFKEKPDVETAKKYLAQSALWNAGIFAFKLGYLLNKAHSMIDFEDYRDLFNKYDTLTKISFDYAVVEKESSIQVLRYSGDWKDVGTWNMMAEVMADETKGKAILDETCENTNVVNELNIPILCMSRLTENLLHMIPHCFSKLHPKYNTPVLSLLLIGVLSVISPFFGKSMLVWISNSASFACCIAYCMVAISFLVLRKKMANEPRPYKVKHFKFVGVMAIFMAGFMVLVYIFPWFGCNLVKQEWIIIGGWGTLGIIFSAICKMVYKDKYGVML